MIEAFPLQWPNGFERIPGNRKKSGVFFCTVAQARDSVLDEIRRLGGKNPVISSNVPLKRDGAMYGNEKPIDGDTGIAVYFIWENEQYVLACDQYVGLSDNLRAVAKSIDAMRGLKRWGASDILKRAFTGFKALQEGKKNWWEVLQLPKDASIDYIKAAYRLLAKKYHTDNQETGDKDRFLEVQVAYDAAMKNADSFIN